MKQESFFLSETVKYLWLLFSAAPADGATDQGERDGGSTARLLDGVVLTTEGHPLPPYPPLPSSPEAEEGGESSSSPSSPAPASCSRLCSSLSSSPSSSSSSSSSPFSSSLAISRSLSAAMPLLSPTERDVETLRRRRCLACRAVEAAMAPVREHWAREMREAEKAAALAMERAESAAAAAAETAETEAEAETEKSGGPSRATSSPLENLLLRQQRQQLQEQRQLLQQLQFLQQQQQQQRPPVAQVLCRLHEVVVAATPLSSSSPPSSPLTAAAPRKTIACGSLSLVPREQRPIKPELVPAETLVLQVVRGDGGDQADGKDSPPPSRAREWGLRLRVSPSSSSEGERPSIPVLHLSGSSAEFGPSLASAAECEERGGEDENVGGRPCSVSGLVVAARPADACSSPLTFEPAIPAGSTAAGLPLVVVVERGSCDFEAKVSAVARALPPGPSSYSYSSSSSAGAAAVVVLSGDDAPLSMGRRRSPSPLSASSSPAGPTTAREEEGGAGPPREEGEEPPIPSMLLPRSQAERLRSAIEGAASDGPLLRAELRATAPGEGATAAATAVAGEGGGSGGGPGGGGDPAPPLGVDGGSSSAPLPSLGTVSISALAPASAAAWLNERDGSSGGSGSETSGSGNSGSLFSGTPLLQQLLATVARSREFAALLQQVAREEEKEK